MASFWLDQVTDQRWSAGPLIYSGNYYPTPTPAILTSLGFLEVQIDPRPDDRFYIVYGPNNDGSWNSTPRDLTDLKEGGIDPTTGLRSGGFIAQYETQERQTLAPSDYRILDAFESSTPIPADWHDYRNNVRLKYAEKIVAVNNAADIPGLQAVVDAEIYLPDPPNAVQWVQVFEQSAPSTDFKYVTGGGTPEETVNPYVNTLQPGWIVLDSRISDQDPTTAIPQGAVLQTINPSNGVTTWDQQTTLSGTNLTFEVKIGPASYL